MDYKLYNRILNINANNLDISIIIKNVINDFKKIYMGISGNRMCKVFSHNIYCALRAKKVNCRKINIKNLNGEFDHEFVICWQYFNDTINYYLIDYTFNQFLKSDIGINLKNINAQLYCDLCNCRYSVIDDKSFNQYLKGFKVPNIIILNDIILEDISRIKKK